ncbi:transposon ty3-i Gag-Pol polyprotein [Plakobranchus ocellatus]|uniref:Transposon ty3-i Gag-Pol polyprotein n=1 Tax=Plakobranchus ocellatus TaxID=259542 RepID=A0AAV4A0D0_9GAST|nr:transposon ty3-i Gag-Pol polyprotein [Plakobranchus ocellatus]
MALLRGWCRLKNLISKAGDTDPYLALLNLRAAPLKNLPSPAELLMGRKLKTKLPIASKLLRPKKQFPAVIKNTMRKSQADQQKYYKRGTKSLPLLKTGESVFVRNPDDKKWRPAKVVGNRPEPRSYMVQTSGGTYRRNRRDILKPSTSYAHQLAT